MTRSTALVSALLLMASAGCRRPTEPPKAETPSLNVTDWTEKTELYMEYPPLVAAHKATFAVHLTRLSDFQPLTAGRPRLEFTVEAGGASQAVAGTEPSRPGAFRVEGDMPAAGRYRWALVIEAPGLSDRHELGSVTVYATSRPRTPTPRSVLRTTRRPLPI